MSKFPVVTIAPAHFAQLAALQQICYPTLGPQELMRVEHFAAQFELFAAGQFVVLDGERVIGQGSGFLTNFDFEHPNHTFAEICAGFYFANHDPAGAYYYGADISVHPAYRGRGIGRQLYVARQGLVKRLNRRGIVAGGLLPGYAAHKSTLTVHDYVDRVVAGELYDPTLSFQLRNGFRLRGLLQDYIDDSASDHWSTLIEWVNPDYQSEP